VNDSPFSPSRLKYPIFYQLSSRANPLFPFSPLNGNRSDSHGPRSNTFLLKQKGRNPFSLQTFFREESRQPFLFFQRDPSYLFFRVYIANRVAFSSPFLFPRLFERALFCRFGPFFLSFSFQAPPPFLSLKCPNQRLYARLSSPNDRIDPFRWALSFFGVPYTYAFAPPNG